LRYVHCFTKINSKPRGSFRRRRGKTGLDPRPGQLHQPTGRTSPQRANEVGEAANRYRRCPTILFYPSFCPPLCCSVFLLATAINAPEQLAFPIPLSSTPSFYQPPLVFSYWSRG
jgi:hypothetical protein